MITSEGILVFLLLSPFWVLPVILTLRNKGNGPEGMRAAVGAGLISSVFFLFVPIFILRSVQNPMLDKLGFPLMLLAASYFSYSIYRDGKKMSGRDGSKIEHKPSPYKKNKKFPAEQPTKVNKHQPKKLEQKSNVNSTSNISGRNNQVQHRIEIVKKAILNRHADLLDLRQKKSKALFFKSQKQKEALADIEIKIANNLAIQNRFAFKAFLWSEAEKQNIQLPSRMSDEKEFIAKLEAKNFSTLVSFYVFPKNVYLSIGHHKLQLPVGHSQLGAEAFFAISFSYTFYAGRLSDGNAKVIFSGESGDEKMWNFFQSRPDLDTRNCFNEHFHKT